DWSGQWQRVPDGGPPRYDPSKPDGRGQQAPLTEEYRRIHEASMADQATGGQGLYISSVKCIPMGMPYTMSIVFPFEFVITDKKNYAQQPVVVWPENNCTEGNSDVVIGDEQYMIGGDGNLMPVRKGQKPPNLRHFQ